MNGQVIVGQILNESQSGIGIQVPEPIADAIGSPCVIHYRGFELPATLRNVVHHEDEFRLGFEWNQ